MLTGASEVATWIEGDAALPIRKERRSGGGQEGEKERETNDGKH